jgi:hypothetical protein
MDMIPIPGSELLPIVVIGTQPLMVSSSLAVMKQGTLGKRLAELTRLRKRTEADNEELRRVKFFLALYYDPQAGVYLPGYNLRVAIVNGARFHKLGKDVERGVIVLENKLPLEFDGSKLDPDKLYEDGRFVDIRPARVKGRGMIEAVRPIFPEWKLKATIAVNTNFADTDDIKRAIETAGLIEGLGTWRTRFGRFEVSFGKSSVAREVPRKVAA